jgi:2-hydroxychromene-2-carboxylate isomerase
MARSHIVAPARRKGACMAERDRLGLRRFGHLRRRRPHQYFRNHLSTPLQSKNLGADAGRRCTQIAARRIGVFERYVDEMYRHMWAEPKKLDDPDVLRAALVESRLDGDRILTLAQTQDVKDELLANTQRSVERGTFGSPTFFVGEEIYFGKDRLRDVEEAIA